MLAGFFIRNLVKLVNSARTARVLKKSSQDRNNTIFEEIRNTRAEPGNNISTFSVIQIKPSFMQNKMLHSVGLVGFKILLEYNCRYCRITFRHSGDSAD
jgi:hypothetical protein